MSPVESPSTGSARPLKRLVWLALCILAGAIVAAIGVALSDNPAWVLAIPAVMAVGWLLVADPTQCDPHKPR